MSPRRTIVFGDVHGCLDELAELMRAVGAGPEDRLIGVGDLLGKGPDSGGVLAWAMGAPNLACVLGNHELRFLESWRRGTVPDAKSHDRDTVRQLGSRYDETMRFIASWPLTVEDDELLVVHAGFDPREPLAGQPAERLTGVRWLEDGKPWYERYAASRLAVFGHWARPEPMVRSNAIGLDTGCVYGGALTALILPERRLVRVPARRVYREKEGWPAALGTR